MSWNLLLRLGKDSFKVLIFLLNTIMIGTTLLKLILFPKTAAAASRVSTMIYSVLSVTFIVVSVLFATTAHADAGSPTLSFGNGGVVTTAGKILRCIATQSDGKIITAGSIRNATGVIDFNTQDFVMMRYNADGTLDNTFNGNGIVITDFDEGNDIGSSIALQSDGKIVLAGTRIHLGIHTLNLSLARYNTDGSLDSSFGSDGKLLYENLSTFDGDGSSYSMVIQSDDKLVISGSYSIRRFNVDGTIDTGFGTGGNFIDYGNRFFAVGLQNDGKIVAAGGDANFYLLRLNIDGSIDNSFGVGGRVTTGFGGSSRGNNIAFQPDGKILVSGETTIGAPGSQAQFALARYNTDGSLDNSFDGDGKVTTSFAIPLSETLISSYNISLQDDGKIVMAGGQYLAMARYNTDGTLDNSFEGDGKIEASKPGFSFVRAGLILKNQYYVIGLNSEGSFLAAFSLDTTVFPGLSYRYYEGDWDKLPDFNSLEAINSGVTANISLTPRPSATNDHFGYLWEGYINIQTPGNYTFETVSDDGSKLYFNSSYSAGATALVSNDGLHASRSATGSIVILAVGLYPIAITFFEKDGGENILLYWSGPGIERQIIPASLFTPKQVDGTPPSTPADLRVVYKGRTFARLDWESSTDNIAVKSYEVYANGNKLNVTTQSFFTAENLQPNTAYIFTVKAVDPTGNSSTFSNPSSFTTISNGLHYKFFTNISYGSAGFDGVTPAQAGETKNADISIRPTGVNENYAFIWEGYINIPRAGTYDFETVSDDGSRFYFNHLYSSKNVPSIDNFSNNGLHAPELGIYTVNIPSAGLYPISLTYNQYGGGQTMQLYWRGPQINRQRIPDGAFIADDRPGSLINGLEYKYYEGTWTSLPDFNGLIPIKGGLGEDINLSMAERDNNFAVLWQGYITVPAAGDYTFETVSDDGSKLYFNSLYAPTAIATISNDGIHASTSSTAVVHVGVAGTYPITISYFENTGDEKMEVYWSGPHFARQLIPTEVLSPRPSSQMNRLTYSFYENKGDPWTKLPDFTKLDPTKTGNTANIDISVRPKDRNDQFAFVWQGYINIPAVGNYNFEIMSDDGSKLYFDNLYDPATTATLNNDGSHSLRSTLGFVKVTSPGVYPIAITYFDEYRDERMEVFWSGPGFSRQRISDNAFTLVNSLAVPMAPAMYSTVGEKATVVNTYSIASEPISSFSVYPNPFHENLVIDFYNSLSTNDVTVSIFDLNGRKVYNYHAGKLPAGNNLLKINLAGVNMKEGLYVVQTQVNGIANKTLKVMKLKK